MKREQRQKTHKKKQKYSQSSQNYNSFRQLRKKLMKITEVDESEQLFEDDPRAAKEKDVGRIRKKATHIFTKSTLSDI